MKLTANPFTEPFFSANTPLTVQFGANEPVLNPTGGRMPWIRVAPNAPYFVTEEGKDWTPIGQNDGLTWPDLAGAFRGKDLPGVEKYFSRLAAHGVTSLRLMLEYCQTDYRYFERPAGVFQPHLVEMWDYLFSLCEKYGLRLMLTPFDTFWMRHRWGKHPYNRTNGGPCRTPSQWLTCPATLEATKRRLAFATERWGGSGALFSWDLWNELDPRHAGGEVLALHQWVSHVSEYLRDLELRLHGKAHLQTVSVYGPMLKKYPELNNLVFRHPLLDFASVHFYDEPIRCPLDPVKPAIRAGLLTKQALEQIQDNRPFLDSEHGPDRSYRRRKAGLPQLLDDAYFRFLQWAHLASGGAGGGFRWPYRHPHSLTPGMRTAQQRLARFAPLIDWQQFDRKNLSDQIRIMPKSVTGFACGTSRQVIVYLLRKDWATPQTVSQPVQVHIPGLEAGMYRINAWSPLTGQLVLEMEYVLPQGEALRVTVPLFESDAIVRITQVG